jgi:hypothetical protein
LSIGRAMRPAWPPFKRSRSAKSAAVSWSEPMLCPARVMSLPNVQSQSAVHAPAASPREGIGRPRPSDPRFQRRTVRSDALRRGNAGAHHGSSTCGLRQSRFNWRARSHANVTCGGGLRFIGIVARGSRARRRALGADQRSNGSPIVAIRLSRSATVVSQRQERVAPRSTDTLP